MATEIKQLLARIEETYKSRDAEGLAELHHSNARYPLQTGGFAVGREEIRKHLPSIFDATPGDVESETIMQEIEQITPDLAIIDTRVHHFRKKEKSREPICVEGFTMVATRENGEWLIAALRGALIPES